MRGFVVIPAFEPES